MDPIHFAAFTQGFNPSSSTQVSSPAPTNTQNQQNFDSSQADDEEILAERKQSQIQNYLQRIKKLDSLTEFYKTMVKESADLDTYERDTYLGKPIEAVLDKDQVVIEETTSDISLDMGDILLSKIKEEKKAPRYEPEKDNAFKVEEYDLLLQYVAGTEPPPILNEKMQIKNDLQRLCQLFLEANTKFKLSMPSENVENILYEKIVYNICQQMPTAAQIAGNTSFRDSANVSMIHGSTMVGSIYSDKSFNKNSTSLMSDSTSSFSSVGGSKHLSASMRNSSIKNQKQTEIQPIIIRTEEKKIEQCTPYIVRMDSTEDSDKILWQKLVDELRVNNTVAADILCLILEDANTVEGGLDLSHKSMLVNLPQFFFDNIYQDDRMAYSETNYFLRIFMKFASTGINSDRFTRDSIGQVQFKSEPLRQVIMCLFEGVTRKIPSFNFLRFVFNGPFNRLSLYTMDQDMRRVDPNVLKPGQEKKRDAQEKQDDDKKAGFFKKIFSGIFDKKLKEELKKDDTKKAPIKDGEMAFEEEKEEVKIQPNASLQPQRLFSAMTVVYGGPADPFEHPGADQNPNIQSEDRIKIEMMRFESIEQRIKQERLNSHILVQQDQKYNFRPKVHDRIIMNEEEIRANFLNRSSVQQGPKSAQNKTKRDLTYYLKSLVTKNFEQMINFQNKIPFAVRAMLRIILIRSRGITDFNARISVESHEVALLAQIMVGGWLNTGHRNPKCFGIQPTVEKELELEFIFFQAARITFEHLMMMQRLPDEKRVEGFSVFQLNDIIKDLAPQVFLFWIKLINIDISEINSLPQESLIQQSIIRVKDLELLYSYCKKVFYIFKDVSLIDEDPQDKEDQISAKRAPFHLIMEKLEQLNIIIAPEEDSSFADQIIFDSSSEKDRPALVKPNKFVRPMSEYFQNLINLYEIPTPHDQYEYFLLFMRKKNDENLRKKFEEQLKLQQNKIRCEIEKFTGQFLVISKTQSSKSQSEHNITLEVPSPDKNLESPLPKSLQSPGLRQQNSTMTLNTSKTMHHQSMRVESGGMKAGEFSQKPRLVKLSRLSDDQMPLERVTQLVINIYNTLRMVLKKKDMIIETLKDSSSSDELRDLVQIFMQAAYSNSKSCNPDLYLQAGSQHLAFCFKKLNLEHQFSLQNKLLNFFCDILLAQKIFFKQLIDVIQASIQQFGADVFRFEQNITNLKQFHKKFDNQLIFNKTISRYNPEVCLLSHNYELLDDFRYYKGVLLNLSCCNHQTGLPISSYMLFGVVRRSVTGVLEQPTAAATHGTTNTNPGQPGQPSQPGQPGQANSQQQQILQFDTVISEDELNMKKVRDNRVSRYREHHMQYTTVTVSLQNNNTMEIKPRDEEIKLIEAFIQFYTNKHKNNLRTMIRADEDKYKTILPLDLVDQSEFQYSRTQKDKYNILSYQEPFDYMNLLQTYVMFLQHISVMSSVNPKDDYIKENDTKVKQHYDFLRFDLQSRTLRFSIHDYIMRRIHKTIFNQTKPFPKDELVQRLILEKQHHPDWVLTSPESQQKYQLYLKNRDENDKPKDFTANPEWTNTYIYSSSLKTLLKIIDEETPHQKALYITDAQSCAIHSLQIATPYDEDEKFGADLQNRVTKHLMVEVCKIYDKAQTNSRLYSQLMFIHLFNIPVQENVDWNLLNKTTDYMVTDLMDLKEQHQLYLRDLPSRNVAYEMFSFIKDLLKEHYEKEQKK